MEFPTKIAGMSWTTFIGAMLIVAGGILAMAGLGGIMELPKPLALAGGIGLLIIFCTMLWGEIRYNSPQFISPTVHGSVDDYDLSPSGKYAIVPIGSCKAFFYYQRGGEKTVVVPADALKWVGSNLVCHASPTECTLEELPAEVRPIVVHGSEYKRPYFFTPLITGNPGENPPSNLAQIEAEIRSQNTIINRLMDYVRHDFRGIKRVADLTGDIQRLARKRKVFELLKGGGGEEE